MPMSPQARRWPIFSSSVTKLAALRLAAVVTTFLQHHLQRP
jgi:hypothetical protein